MNQDTMNIRNTINLLPFLTILCACQSEIPMENPAFTQTLMVRASMPEPEKTRTYISYGNPDKETETFHWNDDDEIFIYNMTQFNEYPDEICFDIQPNFSRSAEFKFDNGVSGHAKEFKINRGDTLLAIYGQTERKYSKDTDGIINPDIRNIVSLPIGTEANKPQYIVENPDDTSMSYMQGNLIMYDIIVAEEDDQIPDIHFKHLSAIIRITLRNETGHDIYPTKLELDYPDTESFYSTALYCSIDHESENGSGLKIYDDGEFYNGSKVYTDHIGTTLNGKTGTIDTGGNLINGSTYDLYLSTVPRIPNDRKGDKLMFTLVEGHDTDNTYSMTLEGFDKVIEAGKRYWFNLTAVEEEDETRKLMLTSEWLKLHPEANKETTQSSSSN